MRLSCGMEINLFLVGLVAEQLRTSHLPLASRRSCNNSSFEDRSKVSNCSGDSVCKLSIFHARESVGHLHLLRH